MKKIILIFTVILCISCEKEVLVEQSTNVSLVNIIPETSGNCSNGGFKVETGIDINNNGILESSEVKATNFICNGTDGENVFNSLINIIEEPITENCPNGGFKVETGIDIDNSGILDSGEVQVTNFICNGTDGENGLISLINIIEEPISENCPNGGFKVETGIDINNNGILESGEVQATNFICNQTDGENGLNSLINIIEEPIGENCPNGGFKIETGIDINTNGILESDEVQATNFICNQEEDVPNNINTLYDIEGILTYGQSLAVSAGASDQSGDFKNSLAFIGGNSVVGDIDVNSFVEIENSSNVEYAPVMASTLVALGLIESENNVDINQLGYQYLPLTGGVSGGSVSRMNKGTTAYQNVINAITSAKTLANQQGKTFAWRVINWVQGESNRFDTKQEYYDKVELLFNNFNSDIKNITGQSEDIIFIIHQTSPWLGRDLGSGVMTEMNVQEAQLQLANDKDNVYLDGGSYQFIYGDRFHPVDQATVGLKQGVVLKRVLNDEKKWKTFRPISHQVTSDGTQYFIYLKFDVPTKPARFDTSGDIWHNPNGKQQNYGFEVLNNGIEQQTAEPFITLEDTVVLTTSTDPTGMTIRYAVNGHQGGGNLCDSQNIIIRNKRTDYVIDNFAVGFSEYIID